MIQATKVQGGQEMLKKDKGKDFSSKHKGRKSMR
jgi:hypothetical protein